jgi:hypothetical protein
MGGQQLVDRSMSVKKLTRRFQVGDRRGELSMAGLVLSSTEAAGSNEWGTSRRS